MSKFDGYIEDMNNIDGNKMTVAFIKKMQAKYLEEHDEADSFIDAAATDQILELCATALALYQSEAEFLAYIKTSSQAIKDLEAENERLTAGLFNEAQGESSFKILQLTIENKRLSRYERAWNRIKRWAIYDERFLHKIESYCGISVEAE